MTITGKLIKRLSGHKVVAEFLDDKNLIVLIEGFVAAISKDGMTVKALDAEPCPKWMGRKKDGSVNLMCFDLKAEGHDKALEAMIKLILKDEIITKCEMDFITKRFIPKAIFSEQVNCIFN